MHLKFGMHLDGADWTAEVASVGEVAVGPVGMLGLLETRLGLGGLEVHPAARINQYLARLLACDRPEGWFHASLEADGWSTAKQMLEWRDLLVEGGWKGNFGKGASPRLAALAEAEATGLPLAPGRQDRLQAVLAELERRNGVGIGQIELLDGVELLPPVWARVFVRLEAMGVKVKALKLEACGEHGTNLALVQAGVGGAEVKGTLAAGDESVLLVETAEEWEAAETLALWLASQPNGNEGVSIVCQADTAILDQALARHGLPWVGASELSRWRGYLQVLPLVLANAWKPVDVRRLVELLTLEFSPVRHYAARELLGAIGQEPGVGGAGWKKALDQVVQGRIKRAGETGKDVQQAEKKARELVAKIDEFLSTDRYDPDAGMPAESIARRCQWVMEWLGWQVEGHPELAQVIGHARELRELVAGKAPLSRVAVERMLDSVMGAGSEATDRFAQVSAWQVVSHPGQIVGPVKSLVWWGFLDNGGGNTVAWSQPELKCLEGVGVQIESSRVLRRREAGSWRRAFDLAQQHFVAFFPRQIDGEPVFHHPFLDEIRIAAEKASGRLSERELDNCLMRRASTLQQAGVWQLAGRKSVLTSVSAFSEATAQTVITVPAGRVGPPETLSATQMNTLIGCPMKWTLEYHAGLKIPDSQEVPTGQRMLGTFIHRIVELIYRPKDEQPAVQLDPGEAQARAGQLYDELLPSMASELLLPGHELENKRTRGAFVRAIRQLAEALGRYGLVVESCEVPLAATAGQIKVNGFADLLLRDKAGNRFVLDLKWTWKSRLRKEEIAEGTALQLAVYAWLVRAIDPGPGAVGAGFFMLAQGEFLGSSTVLGAEAIAATRSLESTWEVGERSWRKRLEELAAGSVEVTGLEMQRRAEESGLKSEKALEEMKAEAQENELLFQEPPCRYCHFSVLCGIAGGAA